MNQILTHLQFRRRRRAAIPADPRRRGQRRRGANSIELDQKLHARGGESRLLLLPDAGHFAPVSAFYDPQRSLEVLPAILRFVGASGD